MMRFIAGAIMTGASVARQTVVSRSPAEPDASFDIISAVAGAMSTRSAQRASSMWLIAASASSSQRLSRTGLPETACSEVAVMKREAPEVMTTWIDAPRSRSLRTSSGAL